MSVGSGRCHYHPERPGIGICVECRNVICVECTTQFEGINRCATCLSQKLAATKKLVDRSDWSVGSVLVAMCAAAVLAGGVYSLLLLLR
jgi:ribosomal protein L34E